MARKSTRRVARWSDRSAPTEAPSPYADREPPRQTPPVLDRARGAGPYESTYDVSFGYSHERTILLP
jgi:hypothetical protein